MATVNGTAALHIALLIAGVEPDDEVLVSTLTFIAPVNAIRYAGAWPVFVDAEPAYWQMDPQKVTDFLEQGCDWRNGELRNKVTGRRVKAIIPVHILGHPVDIDPILAAARKYQLTLIEDATEGLGARYKGRHVGLFGDVACFSFNGNKLITTGGGGMITTNDEALARRARYLATQAKDDPVEFVHGDIGYNYRLTNIQAAMGCAQLERLDIHVATKQRIAARYTAALGQLPGIVPMREAPWAGSAHWLYTILVKREAYGMDSRALLAALAQIKMQTRPLWQPIHLSKPHASPRTADCSIAEQLNREALSLPCSVGLTEADQTRVIDALVNFARS